MKKKIMFATVRFLIGLSLLLVSIKPFINTMRVATLISTPPLFEKIDLSKPGLHKFNYKQHLAVRSNLKFYVPHDLMVNRKMLRDIAQKKRTIESDFLIKVRLYNDAKLLFEKILQNRLEWTGVDEKGTHYGIEWYNPNKTYINYRVEVDVIKPLEDFRGTNTIVEVGRWIKDVAFANFYKRIFWVFLILVSVVCIVFDSIGFFLKKIITRPKVKEQFK